jgi:ribosome-associated heat shock protein Hsp15
MAEAGTRLDKWLWHARFARTRGLAQQLIEAGKVRINRQKTGNPARRVRPGDVLTIIGPGGVSVCRILGLATRRGPFAAASALYERLEESSPGHRQYHANGAGKDGQNRS